MNRENKGHSLPGERIRKDRSDTKTNRVNGAHQLEITEGGTSHDTETNQASEGHSQTGERRRYGQDKEPNRVSEVLTNWRA